MKRWILCTLILCLLLTGCAGAAPAQTEPVQQLNLSFQPDEEPPFVIDGDELNGNFANGLLYYYVKDVAITRGETSQPLKTALVNGDVTEEDLLYYARQDARAGFCQMESGSASTVTAFTFHYPEYSVEIVHDVLEAPDGTRPLISTMTITAPEHKDVLGPSRHYISAETGYLDREDWGLEFKVEEVTPNSATITCTQSGGQQLGDLEIAYYYLYNPDDPSLDKPDDLQGAPFESIPLKKDGSTTFTIDWSQWYGSLPSGTTLRLTLDIYDIYDPETVHPLMQNFHDRQLYDMELEVK